MFYDSKSIGRELSKRAEAWGESPYAKDLAAVGDDLSEGRAVIVPTPRTIWQRIQLLWNA